MLVVFMFVTVCLSIAFPVCVSFCFCVFPYIMLKFIHLSSFLTCIFWVLLFSFVFFCFFCLFFTFVSFHLFLRNERWSLGASCGGWFPRKKKHFLVSFSIPYKQNFAEFENRYCQKFSRGNVKKNNWLLQIFRIQFLFFMNDTNFRLAPSI